MASAGDIRAGRAYVELGTEESQLDRGLAGAQNKLKTFNRMAMALRGAGLAAGIAVVGHAIGSFAEEVRNAQVALAKGEIDAMPPWWYTAGKVTPGVGQVVGLLETVADAWDGATAARAKYEATSQRKAQADAIMESFRTLTGGRMTALKNQLELAGLSGPEAEEIKAVQQYRAELEKIAEARKDLKKAFDASKIPEDEFTAGSQELDRWQRTAQRAHQSALDAIRGADAKARAEREVDIDVARDEEAMATLLRTREDLAQLEIDADSSMSKVQKELAKLELERQKALKDAAEADAGFGDNEATQNVERIFALRRKLLEGGTVKIQTVGSFSAQEMARQFGANPRALKAAEATAKNTADMADALDGVASALRGGYAMSFD